MLMFVINNVAEFDEISVFYSLTTLINDCEEHSWPLQAKKKNTFLSIWIQNQSFLKGE
jgi:hypothetical protein